MKIKARFGAAQTYAYVFSVLCVSPALESLVIVECITCLLEDYLYYIYIYNTGNLQANR